MKSKLPGVGTSIFSVMTALAIEHKAINLAQGFPDFESDPQLAELASKAMKEGHNQYAPMPGLLRLRELISDYVEKLYGNNYDPVSEITVTSGATEALFAAVAATIEPGDEVIILEPCYDSYIPAIELNGGTPVPVELNADFTVNWAAVRGKMNTRTKMLMINSPHNPSGSVFTETDVKELLQLSSEYSFYILSDEVYEHLIFDGAKHFSVAGMKELKDRSFVVSSFGKSLHVTGWKVGYCLAGRELTEEFRKVHQFLTFTTHTPSQVAICEYLEGRAVNYFNELKDFYTQKRNFFHQLMAETRLKPYSCFGTYFQVYSYKGISDESDVDFARRLTTETGVATIPLSVFYTSGKDEKLLRFCFAKKEETMERAVEKLCKI